MDLPQEIDDYIKESIDNMLGLPVSTNTLELKLRASEEINRRLRGQNLLLQSKLKEKDKIIERVRAEANMNAQSLKKFVEENQRLASECAYLLSQCNKWKSECSLYDHDREALMDFGNEADQRAKEAEARVLELEEEVRGLSEDLLIYKHKIEDRLVDSSAQGIDVEESLLQSVLTTLIREEKTVSADTFLEANSAHEPCRRLLKMWKCLRSSTQQVLSLAAAVKSLQKDKEHLKINLFKAEEEVNLLSKQNDVFGEENKKLLRQYLKERNHHGSSGKHTSSVSAKSSNKRKSSHKTSPVEKKINFDELDSARQPLSPLRCNSPELRMQKK